MKKLIVFLGAVFIGAPMHAMFGDIYRKALQTNKADTAQAQQECKTDKQAIEDMILAALDKKDTATADVLLRTYPMLEDDAKEVELAHKALLQSYTALQDALLQCTTVQKRKLAAGVHHDDPVVMQVPFFDRMLGNIAYKVHADKPAIVVANKNLVLLKQASAYVKHRLQTCKEYVEYKGKCPVCFDSVACAEQPHPEQSELQKQYLDVQGSKGEVFLENVLNKNMVSTCKSDHVMCVQCFYNPELSTCSICRRDLRYKQYDTCLQCGAVKDLAFTHCQSCKTVSVTCKTCTQTSCCGVQKKALVEADHDAIQKQAKALIDRCRSEESDYRNMQQKERDTLIEQYMQARSPEMLKNVHKIDEIANRMLELEQREKISNEEHLEYRRLDAESDELIAKTEKMQATDEAYKHQIRDRYNSKIKAFAEKKKREEEVIKKMAKDSTGSDLVVPSRLEELLMQLFG